MEVLGQLERGLLIAELGVERDELRAEAGFPLAQRGHPSPKVLQDEQPLLVRFDQSVCGREHAGKLNVQPRFLCRRRVLRSDLRNAALQFSTNQLRL